MRKIFLLLSLCFSIFFCIGQGIQKSSLRLQHLPLDAQAPEIIKFVVNVMESDDSPINYLPIVATLDTIADMLSPYEFTDTLPLKKFVTDLHTLSEATELLDNAYEGTKIKSIIDSIPNITFFTQSHREDQKVDSVFTCIKQYYGITTNLRELLQDLMNGYEKYMSATSDDEREAVISELENAIGFEARIDRISRIPYLKSQLNTIISACPRDDDDVLLPQLFDLDTLKSIYESNEAARLTKVTDNKTIDNSKNKSKANKK